MIEIKNILLSEAEDIIISNKTNCEIEIPHKEFDIEKSLLSDANSVLAPFWSIQTLC